MHTYHFKSARVFMLGLALLVMLTTACGTANNSKPTDMPIIKEPFPPTAAPDKPSGGEVSLPGGNEDPQSGKAETPQPGGDNNSQPAEGDTQLVIHPGFAGVNDVGYLHITGYVENHTGEWIQGVKVYVKLFDKDGNELTASTTLGDSEQKTVALNDIVPPDGIAYFHYIRETTAIKGEYDHYELSTEAVASDSRALLDISNISVEGLSEQYITVKGTLTNNSSDSCKAPSAVIVGFSGDQVYTVESISPTDAPDALEPGQAIDFDATVTNNELKIDRIEVVGGCFNW